MAKRPLTRSQLWFMLLGGLALLSWMWWNHARRTEEFERASARIRASMPGTEGGEGTAQIRQEVPLVPVTLERMVKEGARFRWFWIRAGDTAWDFAYPDEGVDDEAFAGWEATMEPVWEEIRRKLGALREEFREPSRVKGEIRTPPASAGTVPLGLTLRVLDLFLQAGYQDVVFEGAPAPASEAAPAGSAVETDDR